MTEGESDLERAATAEGLPVAPSAAPALEAARVPLERSLIDARVVLICGWAVVLAIATGFVAQALVGIIGLVTNIAFYGRVSTEFVSPANNHLGWLVLFIPTIGGLIVGGDGAVWIEGDSRPRHPGSDGAGAAA